MLAALLLLGLVPANGSVAPAAAVWPFDLYFDLKQTVAYSSGWLAFGAILVVVILIRSLLLALTATLADGPDASIRRALRGAVGLGLVGALLLVPVAGLYFVAVAIRYAPFAWVAGGLGLLIGWRLCRRGVGLDAGVAAQGGPVPEFSSFVLYAVALIALGATIASLSGRSTAAAALLVVCVGPLHALVWIGWRRRAAEESLRPRAERWRHSPSFFLAFFTSSAIDRNLRDYDVVPADYEGSLLLLGGADSTSKTGTLLISTPVPSGMRPARRNCSPIPPTGVPTQR